MRARVTLFGVAVVAVALVAGGFLFRAVVERQLIANGDELSRSRISELASLVEEGSLPPRLGDLEEGVAQVVAEDGTVLASSPNVAGRPAISTHRTRGDRPVVRTVVGPDDSETESYRMWALTVDGPDGAVTVYAGRSIESVREAVASVTRALELGLPVLVLLLGLVLWALVGRALRPVEAIRAQVASISHQRLDRRLPIPDTGDEVAALAATMNRMLDRLAEAAAREREFVGNASHELLSPVAAVRAELEVALADPSATDWRELAEDLLEDALKMERLMRDLLFLARADAGQLASRFEAVDLAAVVRAEADDADVDAISPATVVGDRDDLARLVRNLVENARHHARSRVAVALSVDGAVARLAVADDGPGIPATERERVFDRFFQADAARSRQSGAGAGLGLAIARAVVERHHGSIRAGESAMGGAELVVMLPSSPRKDPRWRSEAGRPRQALAR